MSVETNVSFLLDGAAFVENVTHPKFLVEVLSFVFKLGLSNGWTSERHELKAESVESTCGDAKKTKSATNGNLCR